MLARPFTTEPFAAPLIEAVCGFPPRSLQFLGRAGHLPEPIEKGARGRAALFDFDGFQILAMMAGLHSAALPLVLCSRIARPIAQSYRGVYGAVPWGAAELSRIVTAAGAGAELEWNAAAGVDPVALHRVASALPGYTPGAAFPSDLVLALVQQSAGRMFVYTVSKRFNILNDYGIDVNAQPELLVSGVARGAEGGEVTTFQDIAAFEPDSLQAREIEALIAYKRAVAVLTVNVSLAIRNALDAVAAGRAKS